MNHYSIVIFKNKKKRKILKNYKSLELATDFYNKFIDNNKNILFEKQYENGSKCNFELCLIGPYNPEVYFYIKDDWGRNVKIFSENNEFSIHKISILKIEEEVFDVFKKKKIQSSQFIKKYLSGSGFKMFSKLNNKLIFQNDSDVELFSLKNVEDCDRFFDCLSDYIHKNNLSNCLIIKDYSMSQKKYLYEILQNKGISKKVLYRQSTTHLK